MIKLEPFDTAFEAEYWETVNEKVEQSIQVQIVKSCKKFLPNDFFDIKNKEFQTLVLAPYEKLKAAQQYIENKKKAVMKKECFYQKLTNETCINDLYINMYNAYKPVADAKKDKASMRVRLVKGTKATVCPYCNRDFINCRADNVSGAQLDHFFSRSEYPVFAVCLYNLIPVCGNCNRVKSSKAQEFASPYDETIDWKNDIVFSYQPLSCNSSKIVINAKPPLETNIDSMRIREAYQIHENEADELLEKAAVYSKTQINEFQQVLFETDLCDRDIKEAIFGPEITPEMMRTRPLSKLRHDLMKELKLYEELEEL